MQYSPNGTIADIKLTVDEVSTATRVRIPIVHAMEQDDFSRCGGDVYARGHVRTLARAWGREINRRKSLDDNDGHSFFQALGDSVVTGPTLTNVNDFRAIVIDGPPNGAF